MSKISLGLEFEVESCASCGVTFALTAGMVGQLRETGNGFYCPNGHSLSFGNSTAEQLRKEQEANDRLKKRLVQSQQWEAEAIEAKNAAQRSLSATRGQVTKLRKKLDGGVCPYPGCKRHFRDLERHIASEHAGEPLVTDPAEA